MSYSNTLYPVHHDKCIKDVSGTKAYGMLRKVGCKTHIRGKEQTGLLLVQPTHLT